GIEAQILAHLRPPNVEEPDQPAVMVEVSMTDDQRVHSSRVDFQQVEIVGIDLRGEAEVEQVAPRLAACRGFDVQCKTPLACERLTPCYCGESDALHHETRAFERAQKDVVRVVGDLSYHNAVDDRRLDAGGRRSRSSADAGGNQGSAQ